VLLLVLECLPLKQLVASHRVCKQLATLAG
jgi:hypothetical protein